MSAVTPIRREDPGFAASEAFRAGMRQLASGVSLITAGTAAAPVGLVATAICSVSVEPPTLLAVINHSASAFPTIDASGRFAVNILGAEDRDLVARFSRPERRAERFSGPGWQLRADAPPLLSGAIAAFDCNVVERLVYATHTVFLARPTAVDIRPGAPLVHFNRELFGL